MKKMRRVFFSFNYEKDSFRAKQAYESWMSRLDRDAGGYVEEAVWEELKNQGEKAIKDWINKEMQETTVTIVLIGAETDKDPYVDFAIQKTFQRKQGLVGVYVHNMKDHQENKGSLGQNPLDKYYIKKGEERVYLSKIYPTYEWINDSGYTNLEEWVEQAAKIART
jgi:hypothetical protein